MRRIYRVALHVFMSPPAYLLLAMACFVSLTVSYQSNETAANANRIAATEATARTMDIEAQNTRLRIAFCGFLEPYANLQTPPITDSARTLREAFKRAASDEGIGCTPDPTDGK